jgi:hypothetical protein
MDGSTARSRMVLTTGVKVLAPNELVNVARSPVMMYTSSGW